MLVIGLTGGIASGKSSVSKLLAAKKIRIIDADIISREVCLPGTKVLKKIVKEFGEDILLENGYLNRKKLGDIVFNDEKKRHKLNAIVHPAVRWSILQKVLQAYVDSEKYVVLDVPLLIEGPLWKWVGQIVVVYCSQDLQLQRLMNRDNSTREEATARLNSQMPITEKVAYADVVIDNSGTPQELSTQVDAYVEKLEKELGSLWWIGYILPVVALLSAIYMLVSRRYSEKPNRSLADKTK
ncbi:hypothetical protein H0H92_005350 [Tricholoma furcatifolium]|nr:hypothetical protein H0H92_005350 [Tricholoma furcatifolium]